MMRQQKTNEVMIIKNGLEGRILEIDESCGPNFTIYEIETRRILPDGSERREKDWYFANEFIRYSMFVPSGAAV